MAEITAELVRTLREKTNAGMMDCKKALQETNGDFEAAVDYLRKKGIAVAAKKSSRNASDGLVGLAATAISGALVEINSETDFVARNESFQQFVQKMAALQLKSGGDMAKLLEQTDGGSTVSQQVSELVLKIGENIQPRRAVSLSTTSGVIGSYLHSQQAPGVGKIGVLVQLETAASSNADVQSLARNIAMHIAASSPRAITPECPLLVKDIEREKAIYREQAAASGKPAEIVEKMVEGRIRKFYDEVVLLEQPYVMNPDQKVKDVIAAVEKTAGQKIAVKEFIRYQVGEGMTATDAQAAA